MARSERPEASLRHHPLTPTERLLIERGGAEEPMAVVENDTPPGDRFLRTPAAVVEPGDPSLGRLIARMLATVHAEAGVGIAAPQVGISSRVILVKRLDLPDTPFVAYLNPVLLDRSSEKVVDWEGCLSVPAGFGKVRRARSLIVEYDSLPSADGRPTSLRRREQVDNFVARIFQHEVDHLNGVLFVDRREAGELLPKDEYRAMREREREQATSPTQP